MNWGGPAGAWAAHPFSLPLLAFLLAAALLPEAWFQALGRSRPGRWGAMAALALVLGWWLHARILPHLG